MVLCPVSLPSGTCWVPPQETEERPSHVPEGDTGVSQVVAVQGWGAVPT